MNYNNDIVILAIESSCDDTSCAIIKNGVIQSNIIFNQKEHQAFGGVIPEIASRHHENKILYIIEEALQKANVSLQQLSAVAVTKGPGLTGSLIVGISVAKSLSLALQIPLIDVNHMQAHIMAHFIKDGTTLNHPPFPFLCLTVSGGHTQIVKVNSHFDFTLVAQTQDDAVGECFDKIAKILGLEYPGGSLIDKAAKNGNHVKYKFPTPKLPNNNYSFSGIKTAFLYFIQKEVAINPNFISENLNDICASIQHHIIFYLLKNLEAVSNQLNIKQIAISGGVAANSGLRYSLNQRGLKNNWTVYIPKSEYCTDNAAMIAVVAHFKFLNKKFSNLSLTPLARFSVENG